MRRGIVLTLLCVMLVAVPVHATQVTDTTNDVVGTENAQTLEETQTVEESQTMEELQAVEESQTLEEAETAEAPQEPVSEETQTTPETQVPVETNTAEEISSESEEMIVSVEIPDVTNVSETEALKLLDTVVLPNDSEIEIIKEYVYSKEVKKDVVFMQNPVGIVALQEAEKIYLTISMGEEPLDIVDTAVNSFGIGGPVNPTTSSKYGIDWDALPHSFEYNWDNSQNCWHHGVWIDGEKYTTPEGTYDTNVRHKVQLHCDGTNVYLHIIFSRDYEAAANGNTYVFSIDGHQAVFQVQTYDGKQLANNSLDPGTYQVAVIHANSSISTHQVEGGSAHFTVFDSKVNADLEIKIPLSEMARQNASIDLDHIGAITFTCPNLAYNPVTASGASTFPFALAVVAFVLVPGSLLYVSKKRMQRK